MKSRYMPFLLGAALLWGAQELHAQTYVYDDAGRLVRVAYPDGKGISYSYDDADNLIGAATLDLATPPVSITATRVSATEIRVSWESAAANVTGFVITRRPRSGGEWIELATVGGALRQFVDLTAEAGVDYVYRIATRTNAGNSAYSKGIRTTSNSSIPLSLDSGGARTLNTLATDPTTRTGYAIADVDEGSVPYGTAVFRLTQGGVVVSETAVPASPPSDHSRIFIEYRTNLTSPTGQFDGSVVTNTGFAIVNTGEKTAGLTYTLRDAAGQMLTSGIGTLAPGAHFAKFIHELSSVASGFVLPPNFPDTIGFGSLDIEADSEISVMALRLTFNQRGEVLFTSTPVADLGGDAPTGNVNFPQLVDGSGYNTAIVLLNTTPKEQSGRLELRDNDGALLTVTRTGGGSGSSFSMLIPPHGVAVFETDGSSPGVKVGWARWITNLLSGTPVGAGVFRLAQGGVLVTESGVPSATPSRRVLIYADKTNGHDTGVAISNFGNAGMTVTVRAFQRDGKTQVGSTTQFQLVAGGHNAKLSAELVPELPAGFSGILEFSAPDPFAALTLRLLNNARGDYLFTTFPVADQTRPAPSPVVFPQVVDGGGFETEFILLGPASASTTVIEFRDDQGNAFPVGKIP